MRILEATEFHRSISAHNLRSDEVAILNQACTNLPFVIEASHAQSAKGQFDHIWLVSVLKAFLLI